MCPKFPQKQLKTVENNCQTLPNTAKHCQSPTQTSVFHPRYWSFTRYSTVLALAPSCPPRLPPHCLPSTSSHSYLDFLHSLRPRNMVLCGLVGIATRTIVQTDCEGCWCPVTMMSISISNVSMLCRNRLYSFIPFSRHENVAFLWLFTDCGHDVCFYW